MVTAARSMWENKQGCCIEEIPELGPLPEPSFTWQPLRSDNHNIIKGTDWFGPFGRIKILCADSGGQTAVYDANSCSLKIMPVMNAPKGPMHIVVPLQRTMEHVTSAAACGSDSDTTVETLFFQLYLEEHTTENVYVMDMSPKCPCPFECLFFSTKGWVWRPLPMPSFLQEPGYQPRGDSGVVVDGNTILVSPSTDEHKGIGSYIFDTVSLEWKKAGDWVLPFLGKAEYDPKLGYWFGLSHYSPHHLCAISSLDPPMVNHLWSDLDPPEGWLLTNSYLVNLGAGRFCTVKFFDARDLGDGKATVKNVAVFTGVEVVRCGDRAGGLDMVKHKSKCVTNLDIMRVL